MLHHILITKQFNSGWPITLTASAADSFLGSIGQGLSLKAMVSSVAEKVSGALSKFVGATDTDKQHTDALAAMSSGKKTYMAAVSPWFFTHYGADTFNKNVSSHSALHWKIHTDERWAVHVPR